MDDYEDSVTMMAAVLRSKGYYVATAHDGTAALEIATTFYPELVVLDIGLPEIDGYEVARRLRKIPAMAGTFIFHYSSIGLWGRAGSGAGLRSRIQLPSDKADSTRNSVRVALSDSRATQLTPGQSVFLRGLRKTASL